MADLFTEPGTLLPLRGRQVDLIPRIAEAIKQGHKRIVVQLPTGGGKTVVAAHLMKRSADKGHRPMFVAPAIALVEQTLVRFESQGISDIGVIQAKHARTDFRARIQIASRDTLVRRALPSVDFVIVDECHQMTGAMLDILNGEAWQNKVVIGLSATPWAKGMGLHWTDLIIGATVRQMIEDGAPTGLCPMRIYVPQDDVNMAGVKTIAGDFQESGASAVMSTPQVVGDSVQLWLKHRQSQEHPGDRTFLYGVTRSHARVLMEAFEAQGVPCGYVDGETGPGEREIQFRKYRNRETKVLCNVGVLLTGVDEDVRCMLDCAPTKSQIRHVQKTGRVLRLADGKDYALILDQAGNNIRVGMVTDIHHETLDMRSPKEKGEAFEDDPPVAKPRKCSKCYAVIPPKTKACPQCGDVYVRPSTTEHVEGELVLLGSQPTGKKPKKHPVTMAQKQEFWSQILGLAAERGKERKWCLAQYQSKFHCWPRGLIDLPKEPTLAIRSWDQSRRIAWAKSRAKEQANVGVSA